jgi:hypothetical protein
MFNVLFLAAVLLTQAESLPIRPNPIFTPGAIASIDTAKVCTVGYSKKNRKTSAALKARVYRAYAITDHPGLDFEVDHLIPLSLGGADVQRNLWPQSYLTPTWNAHTKDRLENYLHRRVCVQHSMTLIEAQRLFQRDWISAYNEYLK